MPYKTVNPSFTDSAIFSFDAEGADFEGTLLSIRRFTPKGQTEEAVVGDFVTPNQEKYTIFLPAHLRSLITKERVGKQLHIVFNGKKKSPKTNRIYNDFTVEEWVEDGEAGEEEIPF